MKDIDLDGIFAAIPPPLVVHLAVPGRYETPCGVARADGAWLAITSYHPHRVTCPDCLKETS